MERGGFSVPEVSAREIGTKFADIGGVSHPLGEGIFAELSPSPSREGVPELPKGV
jgi:hypothetical protein